MENKIVLSILIPTRNREEYALLVIKQILSIPYNNFQLVIQDNSETDSLYHKLNDIEKDNRLSYYHENKLLSFVDNFSLGLDHCIGEYVIILGDDDGVNPDIVEIAAWASKNNIDAITPSLPLVYFWPQSGVSVVDSKGTLYINHFSGSIKTVHPKSEVIHFLKNGCHNYLAYDLAKAYHGIVKKSILDTIKAKTGKYIGGLTPDIYLSIAISLIINNLTVIDYPLTISGICNKSGSSDSATGKHTGKLKDAPHFKGQPKYVWSKNIPPFYSVETIWADSALAAINDLEEISILKHFRINILTVRCLNKYPEFKDLIMKHYKETFYIGNNIGLKQSLLQGRIKIFSYTLFRLALRIYNKITKKNKRMTFHNINDINKATNLSFEYINDNVKNLIQFIKM